MRITRFILVTVFALLLSVDSFAGGPADPVDELGFSSPRVSNLRSRAEGSLSTNVKGGLEVSVLHARHPKYSAGLSIGSEQDDSKLFGITLALRNTSNQRLRRVSIQVGGDRIVEPGRFETVGLGPGETIDAELTYRVLSRAPLQVLSPEWEENVPVAARVVFWKGRRRYVSELPVDYQFYAGWSFGPDEIRSLFDLAYSPQPGLIPYVEEVRARSSRQVEQASPRARLSRFSAARETALLIRGLGLRYESDPLYLRDGRAVFAYQQFPTETLYYGGDCEDFVVLYGFFLNALGIPFAVSETEAHVIPLVELGSATKGIEGVPAGLREYVIAAPCGEEQCAFLPVDLTLGVENQNGPVAEDWFEQLVADSYELYTRMQATEHEFTRSADTPPRRQVQSSRKSWLGQMTYRPTGG